MGGGRLRKLKAYGNCRDFNPCANADAMFFHLKVNFEKKSGSFPLRNFRFLY